MSEVYNPYQFVPVSRRTDAQRKLDVERAQVGSGAATHERYVPGTHSGRIVCRVTTKTPLVCGGRQDRPEGGYAHVEPYKAGDGRPAIPGSALRGLIASLVEAASNSSLRVLDQRMYSFRKPFEPKHTLSALGMLVKVKEELRLMPLALPTLEKSSRGDFAVPPKWRAVFPKPLLKVYLGDKRSIRKPGFGVSSQAPEHVAGWTVRKFDYNKQGGIDDANYLHCKDRGKQKPRFFLVSQEAEGTVPQRDGYWRVLGCWGDREESIPEGKKHELWLPVPEKDAPKLPLHPTAVNRFHALADERTEESIKSRSALLPFDPMPSRRNLDPATLKQKFRLKHGDIVYFDVNDSGTAVTEIALSAIWRGRVEGKNGEAAGSYAFFEGLDADLLPFQPKRNRVTIAEQMFGFVEDLDPERKGKEKTKLVRAALTLASRIRFSDGLLGDGVTKDQALEAVEVPLRILASPKPPCPSMYFRPKQAPGWVAKVDLSPDKHQPNGRKMYLHHKWDGKGQPWRTQNDEHREQKNKVRPVKAGQVFEFHIDYDNLTDIELGLLLYGLAPNESFHHKLGMGKPLGLGSVKIEVKSIAEVNRAKRYTLEGLGLPRFESVCEAGSTELFALRDRVVKELVSRDVHQAICTLGDLGAAPESRLIHTPTLADQPGIEVETFRWFVANDGGMKDGEMEIPAGKQSLPAVGGRLTRLRRPEWQVRQRW